LLQRINSANPDVLAVTVISVEEQLRGRLQVIRRAASEEALMLAYARLGETVAFFNNINLLLYTSEAHAHYLELQRQRIRIGTRDLRIAAIALSIDAIVVTRNQRDFSQISGLLLEDWTIL
jgi:tRNA(fMet)-specific endonuclease VapC